MTWVVIAWCVLTIWWAISVATSVECKPEVRGGELREVCEATAAIGVAFVLFIGFFGFVFFSIIWFMTRPKNH